MNFCNPDKIPEYDSFIELYGSAINRHWTILENITVEISGSTNPKEFLRELSFDLEIDLNILLNSPYQCFPKRSKKCGGTADDLVQNDIIIASLDLCLEEKYALIAHEIGHFVYIYSKISPTVLTEEMFADDCAIELGLKNPLKSALGKCINSKLYANIDELKARINRLNMQNKKIIRACTVPKSLSFVEGIVDTLKQQGFDVVLLSSPGPEWEKFRQNHDNKCIEVTMERHISLVKDIKSLVNMISVFRKEKPYMVHSMTPKAGMLCMLAGWLTGVPVRIHTFTGLVWPTSTGLKRKILMATDWLTCACATHVIPEGQGVLQDLKNGGITKKPMKVLGYGNVKGVDMERFDPKQFLDVKKDESLFTFVFVGRIVGDKGINELVEAFSKLNEKHPNTRLILVGKYEENLDPVKPVTLQRIKENPAIDASGPKYGDDLLREYVKADCFIMPSYREGFPNTVMEAGALGLPSIVTDINGSREIIVDGENGLIVPPRTVEPLFNAMERLIIDQEMREKMQQNARPMIASRFEKSFVQQCLIDYYNEILK